MSAGLRGHATECCAPLTGLFWAASRDRKLGETSGDLNGLLVARNVSGDVGTFHDQAKFSGQFSRLRSAGIDSKSVDKVFDGLLALGCRHVGRFVRERKLHAGIHENAAVKVVRFDDRIDDVKQGVQLPQCRGTAPLANHRAKRVLQPTVLHLQTSKHQVLFAGKVLVERGLADSYIRQDLVDSHAAKAVPVESSNRSLYQSLACRNCHKLNRWRGVTLSQPGVYFEWTAVVPRQLDNVTDRPGIRFVR